MLFKKMVGGECGGVYYVSRVIIKEYVVNLVR